MTVPTPDGPTSRPSPPTRVVVVVPRREPGVHEYLRRALAAVKDVEVVLDRRAVAVSRTNDRRLAQSKNERQLLICSLVRCPVEPSPLSAAPALQEPGASPAAPVARSAARGSLRGSTLTPSSR